MKILILLQRFQAGGAERHAAYLANYLYNIEKQDVLVMAFGGKGDYSRNWFELDENRLINLGYKENNILYEGWNLEKNIRKFYDSWRLKKLLKSLNFDVIIPFTYQPNIIAGTIWKKIGAKKCIWNQQDEGRYFNGTTSELMALKNCTYWVSNSADGISFFERNGITKHHLIYNGIKIPNVVLNKNINVFRAIMLANLHVFKDHITLLKGWNVFTEKYPKRDYELLLVGKYGNATDSILNFIKENNLGDSVKLTGPIENVFEALSNCTISVFSSSTEGLPNAVLESMSIGLPVIASKIPGMVEALGTDYQFYFEPKNHIELAAKLELFYTNQDVRERVGNANQKRIEDNFSLDNMNKNYWKLISA